VAAAVHKYRLEQTRPAAFGQKKSIRAIAQSYRISYSTLNRRIQGGRSITEANQEKQKVTLVQEWTLMQFMRESAD
jgi:hypothetical protein